MNTARWILAGGTVTLAVAFAAFVLLANNFRRSFGASENHLLLIVVPLAASLLLAWLIVPARAPKPRLVQLKDIPFPALWTSAERASFAAESVAELTNLSTTSRIAPEEHYFVIDAQGQRYRIKNFRELGPSPSLLKAIQNPNAYVHSTRAVRYDLEPDRVLTPAEVESLLRHGGWENEHRLTQSAPIGEWFRDYRRSSSAVHGISR